MPDPKIMYNSLDKPTYTTENFGCLLRGVEVVRDAVPQTASGLANEKKSENHIINSLPRDEFDKLLSLGEIVNFSEGEIVYCDGDRLTHIYFPLTAIFAQFQILEDGRTCETALLGAESCIGLSGIFNSAFSASCWTETVVAGSALKINLGVFEREFERGSVLLMRITESVNSYIEQLSQKVICNCFHSMREKFCSRLLLLRKRTLKHTFSATHEGIARALGTHRPSVSSAAKQLQTEKIISYSRGKIKIMDVSKLENYACVCYKTGNFQANTFN